MRINNVGLNLGQKSNNPFKTSRNSSTNPFQNVSFEGNTLPYADVFVGGIESQKTNKLKMIASSVAGSVTKLHSSITEPIVKFVSRIGEGLSNAWAFAKNKELFTLPGEQAYKKAMNTTLFTLPGEEACKKLLNTDIVDIGNDLKATGKEISSYLNKDIMEVGKDISDSVSETGRGLSSFLNTDITELGKGINSSKSKTIEIIPEKNISDNKLSILDMDITEIGKGIADKWNTLISSVNTSSYKISKDTSVDCLKAMWQSELKNISEREVA